jgi:hypothetical protein
MRGALMTAWAAGRISLVALYGHDPRPLVDALAERPRQELAEAVVLSATSPLYLTPPSYHPFGVPSPLIPVFPSV